MQRLVQNMLKKYYILLAFNAKLQQEPLFNEKKTKKKSPSLFSIDRLVPFCQPTLQSQPNASTILFYNRRFRIRRRWIYCHHNAIAQFVFLIL